MQKIRNYIREPGDSALLLSAKRKIWANSPIDLSLTANHTQRDDRLAWAFIALVMFYEGIAVLQPQRWEINGYFTPINVVLTSKQSKFVL
jgi:hypothetical protein